MKTLLTIAALLIVLTGHAQTVIKDAQGNYHAAPPKPTGNTFTDSKGVVYPVYISVHGKLYYIRTSKAGREYKVYLKTN